MSDRADPDPGAAQDALTDHAHSDAAAASRAAKARRLAVYLWARNISGPELLALTPAVRRKLARAADTNPPSTDETWHAVARLLAQKDAWAQRNPGHPAAGRDRPDEKILWVKPQVTPWGDG